MTMFSIFPPQWTHTSNSVNNKRNLACHWESFDRTGRECWSCGDRAGTAPSHPPQGFLLRVLLPAICDWCPHKLCPTYKGCRMTWGHSEKMEDLDKSLSVGGTVSLSVSTSKEFWVSQQKRGEQWLLSWVVRGGDVGRSLKHLGRLQAGSGWGPAQLCRTGRSWGCGGDAAASRWKDPLHNGLFPDFAMHKPKIPNTQQRQSIAILQNASFLLK